MDIRKNDKDIDGEYPFIEGIFNDDIKGIKNGYSIELWFNANWTAEYEYPLLPSQYIWDYSKKKAIKRDVQTFNAQYVASNKKHAMKVYNDICKSMDVKWATNYLKELNLKADIKHYRKIYDTKIGFRQFDGAKLQRYDIIREKYYNEIIKPIESYYIEFLKEVA